MLSTPSPDTSSSEDSEADSSTKNVDDPGRNLLADLESSVTEAVDEDFEEKDTDESNLLKQQREMSDASVMADDDDDENDDDDDKDEDEGDDEYDEHREKVGSSSVFFFNTNILVFIVRGSLTMNSNRNVKGFTWMYCTYTIKTTAVCSFVRGARVA
jgi:hypothetical protein